MISIFSCEGGLLKNDPVRFILSLSASFGCFLTVMPSSVMAFPIFPPHSAYINCRSTAGFMGDQDNSSTGFAGGTATNITWDGSKMVLNAGQTTGTFTSRVIDNSCIQLTPHKSFQWKTTLPYGKPLPIANESTTDYPSVSGSLMNNMIGLWRMNQVNYTNAVGGVIDESLLGRSGQIFGASAVTGTTGKFNRAFPCTAAIYVRVPTTQLPAATTANSHSFWFKGTTPVGYPAFAYRGNNGSYAWSIRMMTDGAPYMEVNMNGGGQQLFTNVPITDGKWHHVGMTMDGTNMNLFVDGVKFTEPYTNGTAINGRTDMFFNIMDTVPGEFDEIISWSRALTDAEMISLYRRGANNVKIQVRSCTSPTCADNPPWVGYDNTNATYLTEFNNNNTVTPESGTIQLTSPAFDWSKYSSLSFPNRYFQYRMTLETENTTYRPDVIRIGPGR